MRRRVSALSAALVTAALAVPAVADGPALFAGAAPAPSPGSATTVSSATSGHSVIVAKPGGRRWN